ncbi:MAG: alpha/beta hydrolase [Bacteroidales bacterium]|nr:alpha/beta hydrolase [Bacteroidales bacterium]
MKTILLLALMSCMCLGSLAQGARTYQFAEKSGESLYMDVYTPSEVNDSTITVVYIFGGGFISGQRDDEWAVKYCSQLSQEGFIAVAIDYRLGLKGKSNIGITNHKPLEDAIQMAAEDAISALEYLCKHKELGVNADLIVLVGCSAGAIAALQTDYAICNGFFNAGILPEGFKLAGVASYSGAILSKNGKVKYRNQPPSPTMFFHGTSDKLVTYKQIEFFRLGFYGSSKLAARFKKFEYPYYFRKYKDLGHSVATFYTSTIDEFKWFVDNYVRGGKKWQVEETFNDLNWNAEWEFDSFKPNDLYKKE